MPDFSFHGVGLIISIFLWTHIQESCCNCISEAFGIHHGWSASALKVLPPLLLLFLTLISHRTSPRSSAFVQKCVQQRDTSRRSMATFAHSQILSPSFRVTLNIAACSLFSFSSSEVRDSQIIYHYFDLICCIC